MLLRFLTETLDPKQALALVLVTVSLAAGGLIAVVGIVSNAWTRVARSRHEAPLKQAMVERGMSAEEIARVIDPRGGSRAVAGATALPLACEAVVDYEGDWYPALVLQVANGQYFIHYVEHDMDSNEWVSEDRIRFPAGSPHTSQAQTATTRFEEIASNGAPVKPPIEREL